jgi:hypothetical protein
LPEVISWSTYLLVFLFWICMHHCLLSSEAPWLHVLNDCQ